MFDPPPPLPPKYTPLPVHVNYASPTPYDTDLQQIRLLSVFHFVVGPLTILFSSFGLIHTFVGLAFIVGKIPQKTNDPFPAELFGWMFFLLGGAFVIVGWTIGSLTICSGFYLRQQRRRMFSVVVAAILCMIFPFGTVLGVFTLIVLFRRSVEALYLTTARTPVADGTERTHDV